MADVAHEPLVGRLIVVAVAGAALVVAIAFALLAVARAIPGPYEQLADALDEVDFPAGAVVVESDKAGSFCFAECPSLSRIYEVAGEPATAERLMAEAFSDAGWSVSEGLCGFVARGGRALARVRVRLDPANDRSCGVPDNTPRPRSGHSIADVSVSRAAADVDG